MPKVPGKLQSSLSQRNPALCRRVKTSQEHEKVVFQAARNKNTSRVLNGKFSQSLSNNTSQRTESRICALPPFCIYLPLHHLPSGDLQQPSLSPHPATQAWHLGKGCHSALDAEVGLTASHRQGELLRAELGCLFPFSVSSSSWLSPPLPIEFNNNKNNYRNLIVFETFTSCRIWWELAKTLLWEGGGKWRWAIKTGIITTTHNSCPWNPD